MLGGLAAGEHARLPEGQAHGHIHVMRMHVQVALVRDDQVACDEPCDVGGPLHRYGVKLALLLRAKSVQAYALRALVLDMSQLLPCKAVNVPALQEAIVECLKVKMDFDVAALTKDNPVPTEPVSTPVHSFGLVLDTLQRAQSLGAGG